MLEWAAQKKWGGEVAYRDLRDFLKRLDKEGELARISTEVDPVLEITGISDRVVKAGHFHSDGDGSANWHAHHHRQRRDQPSARRVDWNRELIHRTRPTAPT